MRRDYHEPVIEKLGSSQWVAGYFVVNEDANVISGLRKAYQTFKVDVLSHQKQSKAEPNPKPYPELVQLIQAFYNPSTAPKVLYFGDSVVERVAHQDDDKRTLGTMVVDLLQNRAKTHYLSHSAYNAKMYYHLIRVLVALKARPQLVIIPVNLRSFSPQWDFYPEYQFNDELKMIETYLAGNQQFGLIESAIQPEEWEAYDALPVKYALSPLNRIGQFRMIVGTSPTTAQQKHFRLEQIFIFHYMHELSAAHPKIEFLMNCVRILPPETRVMFYFTPINYEAGTYYVGSPFNEVIARQVQLIQETFAQALPSERYSLFDYTSLCPAAEFFHADIANEHLNQVGRMRLAQQISEQAALQVDFMRDPSSSSVLRVTEEKE